MNEIVKMVEEKIIPKYKPAVYISGGLDSTILLHHLTEKCSGDIYTYTCKFGMDGDEHEDARRVADHYKTVHREVQVEDFVLKLPEILVGFERPRYNVWVWYMVREAWRDGRKTGYGADGADEHFGGYVDRGYIEAWASHLVYIRPTYEDLHKKFNMDLEFPYGEIDWKETLQYYKPPQKHFLREAYRDLIPNFVIDRGKTPPPFVDYFQLWNKEIKNYFPDYVPKSIEDIKVVLQSLATEAWLESNSTFKINYKNK